MKQNLETTPTFANNFQYIDFFIIYFKVDWLALHYFVMTNTAVMTISVMTQIRHRRYFPTKPVNDTQMPSAPPRVPVAKVLTKYRLVGILIRSWWTH